MKRTTKILLIIMCIFFAIHTIRDIVQIVSPTSQGVLIQSFHWQHSWCAAACDYVTFVPEVFGLLALLVIFKRNRFGLLGWVVAASLVVWPIFQLAP